MFEATAAQTVIAQKISDLVDEAKGGRRIEEGVLRPSFRPVGNGAMSTLASPHHSSKVRVRWRLLVITKTSLDSESVFGVDLLG
jgi:hypothetical protein